MSNNVKTNGFAYVVRPRFTLTGAIYKRLMACSERHYDGKCKMASRSGGFLWGWGNRLLFANDPQAMFNVGDYDKFRDDWEVVIDASTDDVDKAAKIAEMESHVFPRDSRGLTFEFSRLNGG